MGVRSGPLGDGEGPVQPEWLDGWPSSSARGQAGGTALGWRWRRVAAGEADPADTGLVGGQGELRVSDDQRRRWGLVPGVELSVEETPDGLLIRPIDPPIRRVYVEPTSACNLRCRACVRHSWDEPTGRMPMDTYRRLVAGLRAVPSLRTVSFWGFGEPLLHPEIVEMVGMARELGAETELITNGLLLDPAMAAGLVAAGLDRIVVSVDGATPGAHADVRSGADLRQVERNVLGLQAARLASPRHNPEVGLEFVAMRRNVAELPKLRRLARTLGASFVVVTNVLPYTAEMSEETLYGWRAGLALPSAGTLSDPAISLPRLDVRHDAAEPVLRLLETTGTVGPAFASPDRRTSYCRFVGEGAVAVAWDGEVSPCVPLTHSYTCFVLGREKRIRRYSVGSVAREEIGAIWAREEYARFRTRVRAFDFPPCAGCGQCELAETNERDCFDNPFPVCGDCLWAKGVIQCP